MKTEIIPIDVSKNRYRPLYTRSILYTPDNSLFKKIIVFCHGFPGTNRLHVSEEKHELAERLTELGIAFLEVAYQGDRNSNGTFSFTGSINDVGAAVCWVEHNHPNVEIVLLGYSAGGFYALNFAYKHPEQISSLILLNPVVAPSVFSSPNLMPGLWKEARNLLSLQEPEVYNKELDDLRVNHNPCLFVHMLAVPTVLLQADHDEVLNVGMARYFASFVNNGKFIRIKRASHNLFGNEPELITALTQ